MAKLNHILKALMARDKLTETALSRYTSVGQPVIHRLGSGDTDTPKLATLRPIAAYFNLTLSQLIHDAPLEHDTLLGVFADKLPYWARLPLIKWENIPAWLNGDLPQHARTTNTTRKVSEDSYALRIKDTSMQPQFMKGTIVIVDPKRTHHEQDFVIYQTQNNEPRLGQYTKINGEFKLNPLNQDFQADALSEDITLLGTCTQILHGGRQPVEFEA